MKILNQVFKGDVQTLETDPGCTCSAMEYSPAPNNQTSNEEEKVFFNQKYTPVNHDFELEKGKKDKESIVSSRYNRSHLVTQPVTTVM